MFGLQAALLAIVVFATADPHASVSGTLASIGATASGATLSIDLAGGVKTVDVPSEAVVRERAVGSQWQTVSLAALKVQEPVTVFFDASGRVREIDAEYALVSTRAVIVQHGYFVGTDGIARRLVASASTTTMPLGSYVELRTDPATGDAFDASVSSHPFAGSERAPAVAVTFEVQVPANTPSSSTVYLATNAQNWTANAIRLTLEPGNRWTATVPLAAGTVLQYKYTRGSWGTGERDAGGAEIPNRTLTVGSGKAQTVDDVVARWADLPS